MNKRLRSALLVISAALVVLVFPVLQGLLEKPFEKWAADHAPVLVTATLVVGLLAVVLTVKGLLGGGSGTSPGSVPQGMDRLARVVRTQWRDEAKNRDRDLYGRGALLPCHWSPTEREVTDRPGAAAGSRRRLDSARAIVEAYRRQSSPWLVVLGEAGAGKSTVALLLTLGLLDAREAEGESTQPVPVLLTIASWDPKKESLETWLKRRLLEDYPFLRALPAADEHEDVLQGLLDDGRILPVLDGMDEIREEQRSAAITLIKSSGLPRLILTCRAEEYERAVVDGLDVLPGTVTVELEPVEPAAAIGFIPLGMNRRQRDRWQPVLDRLAERPDGPLAQAFSTPLMVSLALDVYRKRETGPEELADETRFATRRAIETHLLDALIPTAFPDRPAADQQGWKGEDVRRWLTHLAEAMRQGEVREIAWWELSRLAPRRLRLLIGLVGGLISGGSAGLGFGVFTGTVVGRYGGQQAGAVVGWVVGVLVGVALLVAMGRASAENTPKPSDLHFGVTGRGRAVLVSGLVVGLVGGAAGLLLGGVRGAVLAVLACLPIAVAYALAAPDATEEAVEPRRLLEQDRRVALIFGVVYALATGLVGGFGIDPLFGVVLGAVCGLAGGLLYGPVWAFSLEKGKAGVISWMHLCFVRLWLAPQGKLPWRVLAFLEEARRRNVLRQAGAVYQFRHASLQDALAGAPLQQESDPVRG